jgi:hypothetical protein
VSCQWLQGCLTALYVPAGSDNVILRVSLSWPHASMGHACLGLDLAANGISTYAVSPEQLLSRPCLLPKLRMLQRRAPVRCSRPGELSYISIALHAQKQGVVALAWSADDYLYLCRITSYQASCCNRAFSGLVAFQEPPGRSLAARTGGAKGCSITVAIDSSSDHSQQGDSQQQLMLITALYFQVSFLPLLSLFERAAAAAACRCR